MATQTTGIEEICTKCKTLKKEHNEFLQHSEYYSWGYAPDLKKKQAYLQKHYVGSVFFQYKNKPSISEAIAKISHCYQKCGQNISLKN